MKYEYKVTTSQGMNTLAAEGWRVVAMHMNSIIMEREIKEEVVSYGTDKLILDAIAENLLKDPSSKTTRVKRKLT